jgi:hypothetical protein
MREDIEYGNLDGYELYCWQGQAVAKYGSGFAYALDNPASFILVCLGVVFGSLVTTFVVSLIRKPVRKATGKVDEKLLAQVKKEIQAKNLLD